MFINHKKPTKEYDKILYNNSVHTNLTNNSNKWIRIKKDANSLPKSQFSPENLCFFGTCFVGGTEYGKSDELINFGIKSARIELPWNGIYQKRPDVASFNIWNSEPIINSYYNKGGNVIGLLGYTPQWANGWRARYHPPISMMEEVVEFDQNGEAQLSKFPVALNRSTDTFCSIDTYIVKENPTWVSVSEETLTKGTSQNNTKSARTAGRPIDLSSLELRVDNTLWNKINAEQFYTTATTDYVADFSGNLRFGNGNYNYETRNSVYADSATLKANYRHVLSTDVYNPSVDYVLNHMTGKIKKTNSSNLTISTKQDSFTSSLSTQWNWLNQPTYTTTTTEGLKITSGNLPVSDIGSYLYQDITDENNGGSFNIHIKVSSIQGGLGPGIVIYKDNNNWIRFSINKPDAGRCYLTKKINGTLTTSGFNGEYSFMANTPMWLNLQKRGNSLTFFVSKNSQSGLDMAYTNFAKTIIEFGDNYKIGIGFNGSSSVSEWKVTTPGINENKVRVFYNYIDTRHWENYIEKVITYYSKIKYWEIWNEPDNTGGGNFFFGGLDIYTHLLKVAYNKIKSINPKLVVLGGALQDSGARQGRLNEIYLNGGKNYMDAVSWHPYNFTTKTPDAIGWGNIHTLLTGDANTFSRKVMANYKDLHKSVSLTEFANIGGIVAGTNAIGGGTEIITPRVQADYTIRMLLMAKKLGYIQSLHYWPIVDLNAPGVSENLIWGSHEGLYFSNKKPKPVLYAYKNIAFKKGVFIDLTDYVGNTTECPLVGGTPLLKNISRVEVDCQNIKNIKVYFSKTATSSACIPEIVVGKKIGSNLSNYIFTVNVQKSNINLKTEGWIVRCINPTTSEFNIIGTVSGFQGTAIAGTNFVSSNSAVSFTIPTNTYTLNEELYFETFVGDDFIEIAPTNIQQNEYRKILYFNNIQARYLIIQFYKEVEEKDFYIKNLNIFNQSGTNISLNKFYTLDIY